MTTAVHTTAPHSARTTPAEIDASCAVPVGTLLISAATWLVVGGALGLVAAIKLHMPEFLASQAWLTFGRVRPAHVCIMMYGWATLGGMGVLLWMLARLGQVRLPAPSLLAAVAVLWDIALVASVIEILGHGGNSVEYLELPAPWTAVLLGVVLVYLTVALMLVLQRAARHVHVAQWYLLAAIVWFPLVLGVVSALLHGRSAGGMPLAMAQWWYAHNLLGLWLVPIALAAACYLIPSETRRPIYSRPLAVLGFWSLVIVYNWAGPHHLIGGPLPAWIITVGVAGGLLMLIPVLAVAVNLHLTLRGALARLHENIALRFAVCGVAGYVLVSVQGVLQSFRSVNELTHFTHYTVAHAHLGVIGAFSMLIFAAVYHALPRLVGKPIQHRLLAEVHFWSMVGGLGLYWVPLTIGGIVQGRLLADPSVPFSDIMRGTIPWLGLRSAAGYVLLVGYAVFAWILARSLVSARRAIA